jgi:diguanylate cyclase (GGDEF)-like protein/PAS domain S-box-containing protein
MEPRAQSRARVSITVLITLVIVLGEMAFLTGVYHLGDGADRQRIAAARAVGAVSAWHEGSPTGAVTDAVDAVAATHAPGSTSLLRLSNAWLRSSDPGALQRLRAQSVAVEHTAAHAQRTADVRAALIHAALLVLVSLGWFVWFRRLIARHRALQRELTEQQVLDSGERRLLALVQNSADLVVVLEPDSTASFVSPAAESVLGLRAADLTGRRFVDQLVPRDVPMFVRLLAGSREGDHPVTVRAQHSDGRELVLEGTLTNLLTDASVHGWVLTVRDITDRHLLQDELSYQAFHDSLTGLANRQLFGDRLAHALRSRDGAAEPLVVLFLDLDDFKHVNDSLGHGIGDQLLVAVAGRISGAARQGDTAARLGGDEFAILMENASVEQGHEVAERILEALSHPVVVGEHHHSVRASIGIAEATPGEISGEETLRNADVAMYWAKDRGKSTIAVYEAGLHAEALERLAMRGDLQRAIRRHELVLHYQPTVDLTTQRITGFEALVRWEHPTRGLLPPLEFIPVAEESGLIVALGSWVLEAACRAGAAMQGEWQRPSMAVNIAAQQLTKSDFVDEVVDVLRRTGMPSERLVLEITESVLLDDMDGTVTTLARLRHLGVRVAIDDFGTGYSSLAYLAQLPVDVLKIDKSFVDKISEDSMDASLIETIITMSHTMKLTTVAEGVEKLKQATWLRSARCTLGQGYLWSRPVPLEAAAAMLRAGPNRPLLPVTDAATAEPVVGHGDEDGVLVVP